MKMRILSAALVVALLAGCAGGESISPRTADPVVDGSSMAPAIVTIVVPRKTTSATKRPAYVSPDTHSISFALPGVPVRIVALVAGSASCPIQGDGSYVCTVSFAAPVGANQALVVKTYQSGDGTGASLSQKTIPTTIVAHQDNPISVTLDGVVASIGMWLSPSTVTVGTPTTFQAYWNGKDAAGDYIVAPGAEIDSNGNPIGIAILSVTDSTRAFTFTSNLPNPGITVAYNGAAIGSPTFSYTLTGYPPATAVLTVVPIPVATPSKLQLVGIGGANAGNVVISETAYTGSFALDMNDCGPFVSATPASGTSFTVTPNAVGTCTLKFADSAGNVGLLPVSVTSSSISGS